MKKVFVILMMFVMLLITSCLSSKPTADDRQKKQTEQLMNQMDRQIGLPNIKEFFEKKMAKKIFELRDNSKLVTHAYNLNLDGEYIYLGRCIGFGLPYSVQYTNPEKSLYGRYRSDFTTIPQADPNGLYMPQGLDATWLILINENTNKAEIIYSEPKIVVTQNKLPRRLCKKSSLPKNY